MSAKTATCLKCSSIFTPSNHSSGKYCSQQCYQSIPKKRGDLVQRFWNYVNKTESCWGWTGPLKETTGRNRYGSLKVATGTVLKQRAVPAHRFSWELHFGAIPDGLFVCHRCDNPPCVNPEHLFLGTNGENIADSFAKGRKKAPDNRGERHGMSKLTEDEVRAIRRERSAGATYQAIADKHNVSLGCAYTAAIGKRWAHVV